MLVQLTSGRGPGECELAVGLFLSVLQREYRCEILTAERGRFGGCFKSVLLRTDAVDLSQGTVQWVCKSPYRPNHRRKNWFIGVKKIEEPENCTYEIGTDVIFQTCKSGGKGGQHVNKTESAVRAIHAATGLTAVASEERSQFLNKKLALQRLRALLERAKQDELLEAQGELNHNHNLLERGNPVRVYEGAAFRRVE